MYVHAIDMCTHAQTNVTHRYLVPLPPLIFAWPYEMLACMCTLFPPLSTQYKKHEPPVYKLLRKTLTHATVNSPLLWLSPAHFFLALLWYILLLSYKISSVTRATQDTNGD